ncbi:dUTP diphosphatase [Desulfovibrio litoralis]|uniref:dUTP diphosphatase n=1 Tax=Desulfovibrio litoralis DSM 11393 TaxID=1121455 RepID=A0A1M7TEJ8_9BACT|nr:dUTP diphosphatase [Desulfovibrio litoralis]SHN69097.1 deoxyuridine 5'-triphosphate nucleotidohydrolase [Desulfovibrio litoralis DSM 11393]
MNSQKIKIKFFRDAKKLYNVFTNESACYNNFYATDQAVGLDLRACLEDQKSLIIKKGERKKIAVGLAFEPIAENIAAFIYSRSGLGAKEGLCVAQGVGIIDPDYRGEIFIYILNTSEKDKEILHGERIAQAVFQPFIRPSFEEVNELSLSQRDSGGFGHSGRF